MSVSSRQLNMKNGHAEKTVREWERLFPDTWILLEVTAQVNGEPVCGKLIATADDPKRFHREWKRQRELGVRTMLTLGAPLRPPPAVVASAT